MALAARCPHCRALFRVVADQLKLRGGLVRCGECRQVFDAIGSLSYVDDQTLARERAEAPIGGAALPGPAVAAAPSAERPQPPAGPRLIKASAPRDVRPIPSGRRAPSEASEIRDELAVPTLFGVPEQRLEAALVTQAPSAPPSAPRGSIEPQLAAAGYRNLLATGQGQQAGEDADQDLEEAPLAAPSFLPTEDQQREQRLQRVLAIACVPLALLAALQVGLALRDDELQAWPSLHPLLARACSLYGCTVGWPARAELLTIIGSELAAIPGTDVIELNAAVRSRANFIMALPAIEVTLTDTQNRPIARKVFLPVDYLTSSGEPSSRIDEGLAPGSDLSVRLVFEARGLNASGFVLYPFYL
ncbi:MAG TPA: DUF3426 domain-containing protein [Burkholderiaceae bacterium]|nr:DUF3426 domain-containing protein [Burkholderiaceae bacterium]